MPNGNQGPIIVDILPNAAGGWNPVPGPEANSIVLPAHARQQIIEEALRGLRRCLPPNAAPTSQTGLVVGYVQSGKTTSFITVAALARDNGYRMVIVVAGTSLPLFFQTRDRLIESLRLESRPRNNPWRHISQPKLRENGHVMIRETLQQWDSPTATPEERRTVLISVMKHHQHLQNLIDVIRQVNVQNVPTLIIDDEGDQAGLNTLVNKGEESTTYSRLLALKSVLPRHSYLQYTATPQAPLLINIVDVLSPSFAEILHPGTRYVGGAEFFLNQPNLVRDIPNSQIPTPNNPVNAPPGTLLDALRLFFVGVAVGYIQGQPDRNCSMMVHPSQRTDPHRQFFNWVNAARDQWRQVIDLPDDDPDRVQLIQQFRAAYNDIAATLLNAPTFEQVVARLRHSISQTFIQEVNARGNRRTPQINWGENYSWILVGGQAMDRGFTVEGLSVTYMPRELGIGNADTVQQRARFFGYKRDYLGLCRVFLGPDVRRAFRNYVEHEEDIHNELSQFSQTGRPMSDWRREFFLNRQLRPTRDNVINIAYQRVRLGDDWVYSDGPHDSEEPMQANRALFERFRQVHPFGPYNGLDLRQNSRRNLVLHDIPLQTVHEELLTRYRVPRLDDSVQFSPVLRLVQLHLIRNPDDTCTVFLMAEGHRRRRAYDPEVIDNGGRVIQRGSIRELFQGRQYAGRGNQRQETYPGDREVRGPQGITVQLSYLDLGEQNDLVAENVPHLAVWIPANMARDTLIQPQGHGT